MPCGSVASSMKCKLTGLSSPCWTRSESVRNAIAFPLTSTGMKRSVAIARALAENPEAVLYDEPTTMVDPLMAHRLGQLIARLKVELKLTSIVVTHDTHLAEDSPIMFSSSTIARLFSSAPRGK